MIAREGRPFVLVGVLVLGFAGAVAWWLGSWWILGPILWLPVALWIPWFFRNPTVMGPRDDALIIAPADGKIVSIVDVEEATVFQGPAKRVSIFMNIFNVHVNRHPVSGIVDYHEYRAGRFFNATLDKASSDNEQMLLGIKSPRGSILVKQIAGLVARRIVCDHDLGDDVAQGTRLGLIRFGSRVDTFFDPLATLRVGLGDHTVAGQTVLAEWPEESP